jgi:hypothetical protein
LHLCPRFVCDFRILFAAAGRAALLAEFPTFAKPGPPPLRIAPCWPPAYRTT